MYEMAAGRPPFYSKDRMKMFNQIMEVSIVFNFPQKKPKMRTTFSNELSSLLSSLLQKDKKVRLGSQNDANDIKKHPFFKDVDWQKMQKLEVQPPYAPPVADTDNFEFFDPSIQQNWDDELTDLETEEVMTQEGPNHLGAGGKEEIIYNQKMDGFTYDNRDISDFGKL